MVLVTLIHQTDSNDLFSHLSAHPWVQNAKKAPNVPLGDIVRSRLKQFSMMNRFKKKVLRVSGLPSTFLLKFVDNLLLSFCNWF